MATFDEFAHGLDCLVGDFQRIGGVSRTEMAAALINKANNIGRLPQGLSEYLAPEAYAVMRNLINRENQQP